MHIQRSIGGNDSSYFAPLSPRFLSYAKPYYLDLTKHDDNKELTPWTTTNKKLAFDFSFVTLE